MSRVTELGEVLLPPPKLVAGLSKERDSMVMLPGIKSGLRELLIHPSEQVFLLSILIAVHYDRKLTSG